jgi:hypothetical protein
VETSLLRLMRIELRPSKPQPVSVAFKRWQKGICPVDYSQLNRLIYTLVGT